MQMIQTPILVIYGIECQPLHITTEAGAIETLFLLENVSDEIADRLPTELFKKINDGRFVTTRNVEQTTWEEIFPGVQAQYREPVKVQAKGNGRKLDIPPAIRDLLVDLSQEQIKYITHHASQKEFVADLKACQEQALKGYIDKPYVADIIKFAVQHEIERSPESLHLYVFINQLFKMLDDPTRVQVSIEAILELMQEGNRWDDSTLLASLPKHFKKNDRQYAWVRSETIQVLVFDVNGATIIYRNLPSLGDCYAYLKNGGFLSYCLEEEMQRTEAAYRSDIENWLVHLNYASFSEKVTAFQVSEIAGDRVVKDGLAFLVLHEPSRFVATVSAKETRFKDIGKLGWENPHTILSDTLKRLLVATQAVQQDSYGLTYPTPNISSALVSIMTKNSIQRRVFFNETYGARVFETGDDQGLTLAQRIVLGKVLGVVSHDFILSGHTVVGINRFIGALETVTNMIMDAHETNIFSVVQEVKQQLVRLDIVNDTDLVSVSYSMQEKGHVLFSDLMLDSFDSRQQLLLILTDQDYCKSHLLPLLSTNWPFSDVWWAEGFYMDVESDGWVASNGRQRVVTGHSTKASLLVALKQHIIQQRIMKFRSAQSEKGTEQYWYVSRNGVRYKLDDKHDLTTISVFNTPPLLRNPKIPESKLTLASLGVSEYTDKTKLGMEPEIAGCLEDLGIIGIPPRLINLEGALGVEIEGEGRDAHISLWTPIATAECGLGGVAQAYAGLLYDHLLSEVATYPDQLYFPTTLNPDLNDLLKAIYLRRRKYYPAHVLFEQEAQVFEEIELNSDITIDQDIQGFTDDEWCTFIYTVHEASLDIEDCRWTSTLSALRLQWHVINNHPNYDGLTDFAQYSRKTSIDLCDGRSLFSRAFTAYIEDSLLSVNRSNDLLVYGATNESRLGEMVFPAGYERFRINLYFDRFFSLQD